MSVRSLLMSAVCTEADVARQCFDDGEMTVPNPKQSFGLPDNGHSIGPSTAF